MDDFNDRPDNTEEQKPNEPEVTETSQDEAEHVTAEPVEEKSYENPQNQFNNSYQYTRPQGQYTAPQGYTQQSAYVEAKPKRKKGKAILAAVLVAVVVFLSAGLVISLIDRKNDINNASGIDETTNPEVPTISTDAEKDNPTAKSVTSGGELSSVGVAEKIAPSIVGVLVYAKDSDTLSNEGTGFVFQEDSAGEYSYILTCAHVISGSGAVVRVQFSDESQLEAEVVGYDSRTDVGVIRVKKVGLTSVTLGSSENLQVGQQVFAVGNPGGTSFFGSFTGGMISAIDRVVETEYTMECIQHDAAISPGNSGGPLVDTYGNVIGINSSKIYTTDGSYEGMGFAIPMSSYIKDIINKVMLYSYVPGRAKLGITYAPVTAYQTYSMIVEMKGLPKGSIIISAISTDSSLAGTDVKKGDMIIAANGKNFEKSSDLIELIESSKVGDKIKLTIFRVKNDYSTNQFDVTVTLVEDKGTTVIEEETTTSLQNPFYFPY